MEMIKHEFNDSGKHRLTCTECTPKATHDGLLKHPSLRFRPYEHPVFFDCKHGKFCATTAYYQEDGEHVWKLTELTQLNRQVIPTHEDPSRDMIYDQPTAWDDYKVD